MGKSVDKEPASDYETLFNELFKDHNELMALIRDAANGLLLQRNNQCERTRILEELVNAQQNQVDSLKQLVTAQKERVDLLQQLNAHMKTVISALSSQ